MLDINFSNIRTVNHSQNEAFEELICQLADKENINGKLKFQRLGKPDGGRECYVVLKDGGIIGWQAKYFTSSLNSNRFLQIDKSVKTILKTTPKLKQYIIAIPLNPSDSGRKEKTMLKKWNEHINKWGNWVTRKKMKVKFIPWWSKDIIERLQLPENVGMIKFWFNKDELTDEWFHDKLEIAIADLGNRYTPKLNFELDIANIFNGIAKNKSFKEQFIQIYDEFLINSKKINLYEEKLNNYQNRIQVFRNQIMNIYNEIDFDGMQEININGLLKLVNEINNIFKELNYYLSKQKEEIRKENNKLNDYYWENDEIRRYNNIQYNLRENRKSINNFIEFLENSICKLVNNPILLLNGKWGVGKSHLIADVCKKRHEDGEDSILLLGQHFLTKDDIWEQILKRLQLNLSVDEFLQSLNSKAQILGSRIIIFIDAINEGEGRHIWKHYIKGFIKTIKKFKWLGLVLSIRDSYIQYITPVNDLDENQIVRVTHFGFEGVEYEAVKLFFTNYGIELPNVPFLNPEFSTPLFLKLFCEGIKGLGYNKIPDGMYGISSVIELYITSINKSLSEKLEYSPKINLVYEAAKKIINEKQKLEKKYFTYKETFDLLEPILISYSNKRGFLDELISEGFFSMNPIEFKESEYFEYIYFTYERMENHLYAKYLIENIIDKKNPKKCFYKNGKLYHLITNSNSAYFNQGLIEALSIQLPEILNKEFYELAPLSKKYDAVMQAFISSLIWRKTSSISDKILEYMNNVIIKYENDYLMETFLMVSAIPNHFFNADFFHKHLMKFSLPDRDAWWTTYIHFKYPYEKTAVKKLIDWGWNDDDKSNFSDESIRLAAKMISWFLVSTNRNLRDGATKALICLLENRINVLISVLKEFENVNDPYIYERLFCVSYGCAMRTNQIEKLKELSEYTYNTIFNKKNIYPHILLRDYARGIIEYTLAKGIELNININKIRPPYKSSFQNILPTNEDIKKYEFDHNSKDFKDYYWAQNRIIYSMVTEHGGRMYGDFGRYVFQSGFRKWGNIDPQKLSNLAVIKIFEEYGYDVEKHGEFDRNIKRYNIDRNYVAQERIGKKYQWIAFYDILARVSDNFKIYDDWTDKAQVYNGPWNPYVRDIDPTIILQKTFEEDYEKIPKCWWFSLYYKNWNHSDEDWLDIKSDLPDPKKIINVQDSMANEWLSLQSFPHWEEPKQLGDDKFEKPNKEIWYQLRSYLVRENEFQKFYNWAVKQDFTGRWMTESFQNYEIFLREYFWSPGYIDLRPNQNGEWVKITDRNEKKTIYEVSITVEEYLWEEKYDLSKQESIHLSLPSKMIYEKMNLSFDKIDGQFINKNGEIVCLNPHGKEKGLECLLIKKDKFLKFLKNYDLRICWILVGEKLILGRGGEDHPGFLNISGFYYLNNKIKLIGKITTKRE